MYECVHFLKLLLRQLLYPSTSPLFLRKTHAAVLRSNRQIRYNLLGLLLFLSLPDCDFLGGEIALGAEGLRRVGRQVGPQLSCLPWHELRVLCCHQTFRKSQIFKDGSRE